MKTKYLLYLTLFLTLFAGSAAANETSADKNVSYLFIQSAKSGTLQPTNQTGVYKLTLYKVTPYVTYFSDRPSRITGLMPTDMFLKEWKKGFAKDAPNVGVEGVKIHSIFEKKDISSVLVLSNPNYDAKKSELTYTAKFLPGNTDNSKNMIKLKNVALFIDNVSEWCFSCV